MNVYTCKYVDMSDVFHDHLVMLYMIASIICICAQYIRTQYHDCILAICMQVQLCCFKGHVLVVCKSDHTGSLHYVQAQSWTKSYELMHGKFFQIERELL
jgi:hypothetical protein